MVVEVLDFAPAAVQRNLEHASSSAGIDSESEVEIVTKPSFVPASGIFQSDLVTNLPYRVARRKVGEDVRGFMIDEERIIGLKVFVARHFLRCAID